MPEQPRGSDAESASRDAASATPPGCIRPQLQFKRYFSANSSPHLAYIVGVQYASSTRLAVAGRLCLLGRPQARRVGVGIPAAQFRLPARLSYSCECCCGPGRVFRTDHLALGAPLSRSIRTSERIELGSSGCRILISAQLSLHRRQRASRMRPTSARSGHRSSAARLMPIIGSSPSHTVARPSYSLATQGQQRHQQSSFRSMRILPRARPQHCGCGVSLPGARTCVRRRG